MAPSRKEDKPIRGKSLEGRIHESYGQLPASERKLADLILDFPGDVAAYSATELSQLAGVSKAAATRFVKRLGFRNFEEARRLARGAKTWGSPLYLQSKSDRLRDLKSDLRIYVEDEMEMLRATFGSFDEAVLEEIVAALLSAKRLWFLGFRNSHFIAAYGRAQFIQFRNQVHLLPVAGDTLGEHLGDLNAGDLLVVIGMRRRVRDLRKVMALAAESGAKILYVTDPTARMTARQATWALRCQISSEFPFDSYAAAFSLLRFLSVEAFRKAGKKGRARLEGIERYHESLGEFE